MKPITPNASATIARRSASGSLIPIATNDIAPEYTLSTFAQTAPSAMASRVRSARAVGRCPVKVPVGSPSDAAALAAVADAAPAISRTTQDRNSPAAAHQPTAALLTFGGK